MIRPPFNSEGTSRFEEVTLRWSKMARRIFEECYSTDNPPHDPQADVEGRRLQARVLSILSSWSADQALHGTLSPRRISVAVCFDFVLVGAVSAQTIYIITDQEFAVLQQEAQSPPALLAGVQKVCGLSLIAPTPVEVQRIGKN